MSLSLSRRETQIRFLLSSAGNSPSVVRDSMSLPTWSEVGASKQVPRVVHAIDFLLGDAIAIDLVRRCLGGGSVARAERNRRGGSALFLRLRREERI